MTKFSYFLGSEQWQPEDLLKHAEIAREAGFDMLTISEHFHPWVDDYSASNNHVAIGYNSLSANTSGEKNTGVGSGTLAVNTTGEKNVAIGYVALEAKHNWI